MFGTLPQSTFLLSTTLVIVQAVCNFPLIIAPLPNTITEGFAIQVQNTSYPAIHNRLMNLWKVGNGDEHLYLSPAGSPANYLTLENGVLTLLPNRAVINGEHTADNTTKMFMTRRNDTLAYFGVNYGCNQTDGSLQKELTFGARGTLLGGYICVRLASRNRYEFRYSPPQNTATGGPCIRVTLAILEH